MNLIKIIIFTIFLLSGCQNGYQQNQNGKNFIEINNKKVYIDIADTSESRYKGLSDRKNLCSDCGMLFMFKNSRKATFVMRNMNFPLDIIWIKNGKIIKIDKDLASDNNKNLKGYESPSKIDFVLEVNGNFSDNNKIKVGDEIKNLEKYENNNLR